MFSSSGSVRSGDSIEQLAVVAIIRVCHVRFLAFEAKFHRSPGLHDPLFFDEGSSIPVPAETGLVRKQLVEAARVAHVKPSLALAFFALPGAAGTGLRTDNFGSAHKLRRSTPDRHSGHRQRDSSSPWQRFLKDVRLRRRHKITGDELKALAGTSFLGNVRTEKEFLAVLKIVRSRKKAQLPPNE